MIIAIEFAKGSSMITPTWCTSCRCLTSKATEGYPEVVDCRWGVAEIRNSKVQGTQNFRQVRTAVCIMPYVLCGGLYCLRCVLFGVPCPPLCSLGDRVT
jgi:hypothetical protein